MNKTLITMLVLTVVAFALPKAKAEIDPKGDTLATQSGLEPLDEKSLVPALVSSYLPGLTLSGNYATPGDAGGGVAAGSSMAQIILALAGAARGEGTGYRIWQFGLVCFWFAAPLAAFLCFLEVSKGKKTGEDMISQLFWFGGGIVAVSYFAGFCPVAANRGMDWFLADVYPSGASPSDQPDKLFVLNFISAATGQQTSSGQMEAGIVATMSTPQGSKAELQSRYQQLFLSLFYRGGGKTYSDADAFADAILSAAKANDSSGDQAWGWKPGQNWVAASDRVNRILGTDVPWQQMNSDARRARLVAILSSSLAPAQSGMEEVVRRDIVAAVHNDIESRLQIMGEALASEALDPSKQEEARKLSSKNNYEVGLSFTGAAVDKSGLTNSYNVIDGALAMAAFMIGIEIWIMPWIVLAVAISSQFNGRTPWRRVAEVFAILLLTAFFTALFGQAAMASITSKIIGSTTADNTSSWLSWLSGIDVSTWASAAAIVAGAPALAATIVLGASGAVAALVKASNPGGYGGGGTGGGWTNSIGKSTGGGSGGGGMSLWDQTNGGNKS